MTFDPARVPFRTRVGGAILIFVAACAGVFVRQHSETGLPISMDSDMQVSASDYVELYLNENWAMTRRQPVFAGLRHIYHFEGIPTHLTAIRLDPTATASARFVIYSITVQAGNRLVKRFSPSALRGWQVLDAAFSGD